MKDPTKPVKAGELEIPGFSSYLHPIGANLILGVGQAVVNDQLSGLQISLFDVSNLAKPQRVANLIEAGGDGSSSDAQYDHKAFRLLENGLLILPVQVQDWSSWQTRQIDDTSSTTDTSTTIRKPDQSFDGFKVYNVNQEAKTITEYYEISHGSNFYNGCWGFSYLSPRSFVFGGDVWTLKTHTILIHDLTDRVAVGAAGGINLDQDLDKQVCTPYYWFDGPRMMDDTSAGTILP
jgi:Beta propeller domain